MRFFHMSDLHIGRQLYQYSLLEDQREILRQVVACARKLKPEAIVIAGDIYDKPVPSAEAVSVFNHFLTELATLEEKPTILMISGNHDSPQRLNYGADLLSKLNIYIAALPPREDESLTCVRLNDAYGAVDFYLMPFIKPPYIRHLFSQGEEARTYDAAVKSLIARETLDENARNVIVAHQFFTGSGAVTRTCDSELIQVGGLDEVDVHAFDSFVYGAFGHIHGAQTIGSKKFRYCGSPLKYSVSEAGHHKTLTVVELNGLDDEAIVTEIEFQPLRDVRILKGELEHILKVGSDDPHREDYVSVTLTDEYEKIDARERLLDVYPNLLELQVDNARTRQQWMSSFETEEIMSPMAIFEQFFEGIQGRKLTEEEIKMMTSEINSAQSELGEDK